MVDPPLASHLSRAEQRAADLATVTLATVTAAAQHDLDVGASSVLAVCDWVTRFGMPDFVSKQPRRTANDRHFSIIRD